MKIYCKCICVINSIMLLLPDLLPTIFVNQGHFYQIITMSLQWRNKSKTFYYLNNYHSMKQIQLKLLNENEKKKA